MQRHEHRLRQLVRRPSCKPSLRPVPTAAVAAFQVSHNQRPTLTRARDGECAKNPDSMTSLCPLSCGVCTFNCTDQHESCVPWAQDGQCEENPLMMYKVARELQPSPSPSP